MLAVVQVAPNVAAAAGVTATDVLTLKNGRFYLDGQPFAEISFNKFDLFWSLWGSLRQNARTRAGTNAWIAAVATQDQALRELHALGFRTIRIFGAPHESFGDTWVTDPAWRNDFFKALDTTLDLCDKNNIKVILSLGAASVHDKAPQQASAPKGETSFDLIANPAASSRQRLDEYIDRVVTRYRNRKSIAMWEVANELTNMANIGKWKGEPTPTLPQVADFLDTVAKRIKANDPLRLVSTGGSHLREHAWNLFQGNGWKQRDTWDEHRKAYAAYFQKSAIDVIDVHYYAVRTGGYELAPGPDGRPVFMNLPRYVQVARELGKGLIFGEYGALPYGWSGRPKNAGTNDDWFVGYNDATAKQWVQRATDEAVDSGAQLVYFWAYQSDRPQDQKSNPVTLEATRTPELVQIIAEGNRRLKAKLGTK